MVIHNLLRGGGVLMRVAVVAAAICLSVVGAAGAGDVRAAIREPTTIAAQPLGSALQELAKDRDFQLICNADLVRGLKTQGISGQFTPGEALATLLTRTGLTYRYLDARTVTVVPRALQSKGATSERPPNGPSSLTTIGTGTVSQVNQRRMGTPAAARAKNPDNDKGPATLAEVVVTAEKRPEKLLDVPASIVAITSSTLESRQVDTLSELAAYVPGLSVMNSGSPGFRTLVIRGLNTSYNDQSVPAMVGTYVGDIPVGSSTANGRGANYGLDLNPYDIKQIVVLEGPQGTLYGANTMGGLIMYVLKTPSLTDFEGQIGADTDYIDGSGRPSGSVRAAVSIPIVSGSLGLRLSGFDRNYAGYIDNIGTGETNVNGSEEEGGRATALWEPSERVSIQATAIGQYVNTANMAGVTLNPTTQRPVYGYNLESSYFREPFKQQTRVFALSAKFDLNFATLSSATGWSNLAGNETIDVTPAFAMYVPYPDARTFDHLLDRVSKFDEEVRLTSAKQQRIKWILGGYYTKEDTTENQSLPAYTSSLVLLPADSLFSAITPATYKEVAAFGNVTYSLTDRWEVTGGLRHSSYSQTECNSGSGLLNGGPYVEPCTSLPNTGVTLWMADTSYHLNQDAMVYFRAETGYRPGSGCPTCGYPKLGIPGIVNPDTTKNYEVGVKALTLERTLQLLFSAFTVDWNNIQINEVNAQGINYAGNGAGARSAGFEFSAVWRGVPDLQLNAALAYTDAHLTANVPTTSSQAGGTTGNQLPGSPRWTGTLMADYIRPLNDRLSLLSGVTYSYRDSVVNQFAGSGYPFPSPPQSTVDLYTGMALQNLTLKLTIRNVFNDRSYSGLLYVTDSSLPRYVPVLPRTIGLSADYRF